MTIRYPLKPLEREALWEAHNRLCYYCRHSLVLRSMEVDHLISQDLADNSDLWPKTLEDLGLPKDFDVDGLNNLVPACRLCNADKSNRVFSPGRIVIDLNVIAKRRVEVEDRFDKLTKRDRRERARAAVAVAVAENALSFADLRAFERVHLNDKGVFQTRLGWLFESEALVNVDRAEIDVLLDRPVRESALDGDGLTLDGPNGSTCKVSTLRAYREAKAAGFFAMTSYARSMEGLYFERPLTLLSVIAASQYPECSHMDSPHLGVCDLDRLTATLLFTTKEMTSDPAFEGERAALEGKSIHDLVSCGEAVVRSVSSQHVQIEHSHGLTYLLELMRADTNGDGFEELVLHRGVGPLKGTYGSMKIMALSIREAGGAFVEVPLL